MINNSIINGTRNRISRIYCVGIFILLSFFIYNFTGSNVFFFVGLLGFGVAVLALNCVELFQLIVFLVPSLMMLKHLNNDSALLGYFAVLVTLKMCVLYPKKIKTLPISFLLLVFTSIITGMIYAELSIFVGMIRNLAFFFLTIKIFKDNEITKTNAWKDATLTLFCNGVLLNLIFGVIYASQDGTLYNGLFAGIRNGRGYFSTILLTAIAISLVQIISAKGATTGTRVWTKYVCLSLCIIGGIISNSRSFLLGLGIVLILALPYLLSPKRIIQTMVVCIVAVILITQFGDNVFDSLLQLFERFKEDDAAGAGGRFELWTFYLSLLTKSPLRLLFGNGLATQYIDAGMVRFAEHNSFIELLSTFGVCGFAIRIACYIVVLKAVRKNSARPKMYQFLPLIALIICFSGVSSGTSDQFAIAMTVSFIALSFTSAKVEEKNDSIVI